MAWVRIPQVSSSVDTVFYLYFGNPDCGSQQNPSGVWDSDFVLVQHLQEISGIHEDSTRNSNHGIPYGGVMQDIPGVVDGADGFNGVDAYLAIPYQTSLDIRDALTLEAWVCCDQLDSPRGILNAQTSAFGPYLLQVIENGFEIGVSIASNWYTAEATGYSPETWYYVVGTYDHNEPGNNLRLFIDGQEVNQLSCAGLLDFSSESRTIGHNYGSPGRWFDGVIDEVRISNCTRSSNWINTTYHNILDPEHFVIANDLIANPRGPYHGDHIRPVRFLGSASGGFPLYQFHWEFGDGNTSDTQNPFHYYATPGDYLATLTVTDDHGHTAADNTSVHIDLAPVEADANGPYYGYIGERVWFRGYAAGGVLPYNWTWDFGDGNLSYGQNVTHHYTEVGEYIATLTVTDNQSDSANDTAWVTIGFKPSVVWVDDDYTEWGYNDDHTWGIDAFDTISAGIDGVAGYGTIHVHNGLYPHGGGMGSSIWKSLDLIGEDKNNTIIDIEELAALQISADHVHLSNFTIQHGNGVYIVWSNQSTISNTLFHNCSKCIGLDAAHHCNISGNTFSDSYAGVQIASYIGPCTDNHVYHNNFINITYDAYDCCSNAWDNGYPYGGNYWDDFDEPDEDAYDEFHGPEQDLPGSDGIVDTPYDIPGETTQDRYPFINQDGWERVSPSVSLITLSSGGLTTCPLGDGPIYENITISINDYNGDPISGIPAEEFVFTVSPTLETEIPDRAELSCTFIPNDVETNESGMIRFTVQGDVSINGTILINVSVSEIDVYDFGSLPCRTFDHDLSGTIELYDFGFFASQGWGLQNLECDYNWDGAVNLIDFGMFAQHWGHSY